MDVAMGSSALSLWSTAVRGTQGAGSVHLMWRGIGSVSTVC
jgi:hypothetical protein